MDKKDESNGSSKASKSENMSTTEECNPSNKWMNCLSFLELTVSSTFMLLFIAKSIAKLA